MSLTTTLAACNTNPALNGPDGADLPSTLDDQIRYALSFIALLRDGAAIPVGSVGLFPSASAAPTGWLKLNGALISRATYATLFAYGTAAGLVTEAAWNSAWWGAFSVGDGSTTFRIPDYRAMFVRGNDDSRGVDTSRQVGSGQLQLAPAHVHSITDAGHVHGVNDPSHTHGAGSDAQGSHQHTYNDWASSGAGASVGGTTVYAPAGGATGNAGVHSHTITVAGASTGISVASSGTGIAIVSAGGADGRPINVSATFCIKY